MRCENFFINSQTTVAQKHASRGTLALASVNKVLDTLCRSLSPFVVVVVVALEITFVCNQFDCT